jgi:hypothetical protein
MERSSDFAALYPPYGTKYSIRSTLMRSPHHLHGVLDVTPLRGFFRLALAFASQGIAGRLRDRSVAMPFKHLSRDGVDLGLGCHLALPAISGWAAAGCAVRVRLVLKTAGPMISFHRFPCIRSGFPQPVAVSVATSPSLRLALVKPGGIVGLVDAA